jgi:DNA-binding NarL/FixJ family response regulator
MPPKTILLVDDHDLMRGGIENMLSGHSSWRVCGEARNGEQAIEKHRELKPDVVIMDYSMPIMDGITAARAIRQADPVSKIVILSVDWSDAILREALISGINAFVCKTDPGSELLGALVAVTNDSSYFSPQIMDRVLAMSEQGSTAAGPKQLTTRETEIVRLIADGQSSCEVAASLNIATKTAETHRTNILRKLSIHNTADLVRFAIRNRIIAP